MKCSNKQCIGGFARIPGSNSDVEYPCLTCESRRERELEAKAAEAKRKAEASSEIVKEVRS